MVGLGMGAKIKPEDEDDCMNRTKDGATKEASISTTKFLHKNSFKKISLSLTPLFKIRL